MRVFIKFDAKKAKAVRVVNQDQTPKFLIESGVPREKIIYIPSLYIDLEIFKPMNLPKEYDLIFIGRLEKNKGLDLLLEAFQILNTKYLIHNLRLLIVGDGPERKNLEFLFRQSFSRQANIKDNEFKKNVIMRGYVKDQREIAELINKSKILVMPSYNEGGPRVVVEAMACGVPVLATSVGIVPDIIKFKSGGAIQIIDWKAEDIAKKAFELLHDRDKNQMYILAGFKIAYQFEKKAMIQNYADKLKGLC